MVLGQERLDNPGPDQEAGDAADEGEQVVGNGFEALTQGGAGNPNLTAVNGVGTRFTVTPSTNYTVCPGTSAAAGCVVGAMRLALGPAGKERLSFSIAGKWSAGET